MRTLNQNIQQNQPVGQQPQPASTGRVMMIQDIQE